MPLLPGNYHTLKHNFQQKEGTLLSIFTLTSGACAVGPSVTIFSTAFSFQNLAFFGIYLNFQWQKSVLKNQLSPTFWIQILPNKIPCSSRYFPTTPKAPSNPSKIFTYDVIQFSVKKSFNIQEIGYLGCRFAQHNWEFHSRNHSKHVCTCGCWFS